MNTDIQTFRKYKYWHSDMHVNSNINSKLISQKFLLRHSLYSIYTTFTFYLFLWAVQPNQVTGQIFNICKQILPFGSTTFGLWSNQKRSHRNPGNYLYLPSVSKGVFWHGLSSSSAGNLYQPLALSHYLSQELSLQEGDECWWQVLTLLCGGGEKWADYQCALIAGSLLMASDAPQFNVFSSSHC